MKRQINQWFSDRYSNKANVQDNIISLLIYRLSFPLATAFIKARLTPNRITTLSLLFTILAFFALVIDKGWILFCLFWVIAVLFDFCDGTVARMTNRVSQSAFRYDHMTDLFKLCLLILGTGLRYNDYVIWALAFSSAFFFMYFVVLSHDLKSAVIRAKGVESNTRTAGAESRIRERYWITRLMSRFGAFDSFVAVYRNLYVICGTVSSHSLLLFLVLPFGREFAFWLFLYLSIILLISIRSRIKLLLTMQR